MDQKNLLLAIVLSVAILLGFQYLFEAHKPSAPPPSEPAPATKAEAPGAVPTPQEAQTRAQALAAERRVKIDTPRLHGSIDLTGARLDDLTLATYHDTVDPKSPEVVLLEPTGTKDPYFAEFGWIAGSAGETVKLPGPQTVWSTADAVLTPSHPVTLTWDNGQGLVFTRRLAIDQDYMFTVEQAVRNTTGAPVSLIPYALISRTGTPQTAGYYILHEGLIGELGGSLQEVKYSSLSPNKPLDYDSTGGWLGFTDKYWLTALVPPQNEAIKARFRHTVEGGVDRY